MKKLVALLATMALPFISNGDVYQIQSIQEVYNYLPPTVDNDYLIVFNVDNTLVEPVQQLGRLQWYDKRVEYYIDQGNDPKTALQKALNEWTAIQNLTQVQLVEPIMETIFADLQNQGYTVIGLTSRGLGLADVTLQQLQAVGIDFTQSAPYEDDLFVKNQGPVLYHGGVIFAGGANEGEALLKVLNAIDYPTVNIVAIEDQQAHLDPIASVCAREEFGFTGLRYGFVDNDVENYNPDIANVQFSNFGNILSDDEAASQLSTSQSVSDQGSNN